MQHPIRTRGAAPAAPHRNSPIIYLLMSCWLVYFRTLSAHQSVRIERSLFMNPVNPYAPPQFETPDKKDKKYERIGGWLILVAIGMTLTTVVNLVALVS